MHYICVCRFCIYIYIYIYIYICMYSIEGHVYFVERHLPPSKTDLYIVYKYTYGVATISRLLKMIGLLCRISSVL